MNKKILLSGGIIAFVAAAALGATYAAWQAQANIGNNIISTAKLSITAVGAEGGSAVEKPIEGTNVVPGWTNWEENGENADRALITNTSNTPLDLYFYVEPQKTGACSATALGWRSGKPNGGWYLGYGTPTNNTDYESGPATTTDVYAAEDGKNGLLALIDSYVGPENAVKIADSSNFGPGMEVAVREVAHFATDAANNLQGKNCSWREVFVGTLPGQEPEVPETEELQ